MRLAQILDEMGLGLKNDTEINQSMEKFIPHGNCRESVSRGLRQNAG
jgi:hypothetical protein